MPIVKFISFYLLVYSGDNHLRVQSTEIDINNCSDTWPSVCIGRVSASAGATMGKCGKTCAIGKEL